MKLIRTVGRSRRSADELIAKLEERGGAALDSVMPAVSRIVSSVRKRGDGALLGYAQQFDGLPGADSLRVTREEMAEAWERTSPALRTALRAAAEQIRSFAERQMPESWSETTADGLTRGQVVRPIGSVGCYVPSGRHPLPSTLLMAAIPAQVAGVKRIVAISPRPATETMAAAHLLGISEVYRVGGAHGIAALAYGTASIPQVDKIVGPGNLYVTAAKRMVAFDCAIDMLAGPTEIIVTSERGRPAEIASDLVAQAEHDPEALAIFITSREELAREVVAETKAQRAQQSHCVRVAAETRCCDRCSDIGRGAEFDEPACTRTSHRRLICRSGLGSECRLSVRGPLVSATHGRLHLGAQPYAAHGRHGSCSRRTQRE